MMWTPNRCISQEHFSLKKIMSGRNNFLFNFYCIQETVHLFKKSCQLWQILVAKLMPKKKCSLKISKFWACLSVNEFI